MGRKKKDRDDPEYLRLSRLTEPTCWDDAGWRALKKVDAEWAELAWMGLARMARTRLVAGVSLTQADRLALARHPDECYSVVHAVDATPN